jgi:hypothetical protein
MSSGLPKILQIYLQASHRKKEVRGILQNMTSKENREKQKQRRPSLNRPTGRLGSAAASVKEARMWKRRPQLSNGNHPGLSADGRDTGCNGRVAAMIGPDEMGARLSRPSGTEPDDPGGDRAHDQPVHGAGAKQFG